MTNRSRPAATTSVALIGAGRVGTAVAELLRRRGCPIVAVTSRSPESARRAASLLDAPTVAFAELRWPAADLTLIGVIEPAIGEVAELLAGKSDPGGAVCHLAGSLGAEILEPLAARGWTVGAVHPVASCPTIEAAVEVLPGSAWGVTAAEPARTWFRSLVANLLDGIPIDVGEADRAIWHAAAVTTSNGMAALVAAGEALLRSIGIERAPEVLGPLASGTIRNVRAAGGGSASLTGPIVRGEVATVRRHIRAIEQRAPDHLEAYLGAARLIFSIAAEAGRLDLETKLSLSALLEPG